MRLQGQARSRVLALVAVLGICLCCNAQEVRATDVDLEPADDGGSGSQDRFYNSEGSNIINNAVDPGQRRAREGGFAVSRAATSTS